MTRQAKETDFFTRDGQARVRATEAGTDFKVRRIQDVAPGPWELFSPSRPALANRRKLLLLAAAAGNGFIFIGGDSGVTPSNGYKITNAGGDTDDTILLDVSDDVAIWYTIEGNIEHPGTIEIA